MTGFQFTSGYFIDLSKLFCSAETIFTNFWKNSLQIVIQVGNSFREILRLKMAEGRMFEGRLRGYLETWKNFSGIIMIILLAGSCVGDPLSDEKRLIKHLLEDYERVGVVGRPVFNQSMTINVQYGLALIQILDLDEKNQVLTTNAWSRYVWMDNLLVWNPEDFGGVDNVRVPIGKIWSPDIVLYNYADQRLKEHREAMAVVSSDGSVLWIPPAIFRSTCSIDITHFPFDVQTCHLKFGSWTYDGYKLDISFYADDPSVDISDYVESNEWELVDHPAKKNVKYYPCCVEPFPDLTFTVRLRRIAAFYNYIIILPCVLLSFLTLVIFWLPPESPAKVMLGMNVFVAFFVLLLLLADNTPPASSSIPLIGAYFCVNMILITLSTFLAIIVINTHIRGDRKNRVPDWLRRLTINGLARVMCMREYLDQSSVTPQPDNRKRMSSSNEMTSMTSHFRPPLPNGSFPPPTAPQPPASNPLPTSHSAVSSLSQSPQSSVSLLSGSDRDTGLPVETVEVDVREIRVMLRSYLARLGDKDVHAKVNKEWRNVARVFDRLFFFIYCSTVVLSLATIFPKG